MCQETVPGIITPTAAWTVDARQGGATLSCCLPHVGLYHQSATADMDTLQRRCFLSMICLTLVSLGEYCLLFLAVRSCTRCALHAFRCSSAYVGCNEQWFDLLLPSNQSSLVVSLLASTNRFQRTAARWMFSAFLCNSWKVRAARLGPPTMLCSRSLTSRFFPFLIRLVFSS